MAITRRSHHNHRSSKKNSNPTSRELRSSKNNSSPRIDSRSAHSSSVRARKLPPLRGQGRSNGRKNIHGSRQVQNGDGADAGLSSVLQPQSPPRVGFPPLPSPSTPPSESATLEDPDIPPQPIEEEQDPLPPTATAATTQRNDPSIDPKDVGLPVDGRWDHEEAYAKRLRPGLDKKEYLLGPVNRWMRPVDFYTADAEAELDDEFRKPGADLEVLIQQAEVKIAAFAVELDALYQRFKEDPQPFQPLSGRCQAESTDNLWDQIDAVVGKGRVNGEDVWEIRWKACWTIPSSIGNTRWVKKSLASRKKRLPGMQPTVGERGSRQA